MSARASPPSPTLTLHGRWLLLVRAAWVAVAVATLGIFAISIPARYAQLTHPIAAVHTALAEMGLSASGHALYNVTLDTVFGLVFAVVAIVIFWRRSDEPMALLVATMMVVWEPLNGLIVQTPSAIEGMYPALEAPLGRLLPYVSYMTWMLFFSLFPSRALRAALDTLALCWVLFSGSWIFTPFGPPSWPPLLFNGAVLALWSSGEASQWPSLTATHASTIEPCTSQTIGISARGSLSEQSRAKAAKALRAVSFVAQTMAESLAEGEGEDDPRTNYGLQR
jgi:hypothetical protein